MAVRRRGRLGDRFYIHMPIGRVFRYHTFEAQMTDRASQQREW